MSEFGGLWKHQNNPACTKNDSNGQLRGRWSLTEEEKENKVFRVSVNRIVSSGYNHIEMANLELVGWLVGWLLSWLVISWLFGWLVGE